MGLDLLIASGFIAAISGLAFLAGRRLSLQAYQRRSYLFTECLIFCLVFAFGFSNRLTWASLFPTPAAICWSNWMPILLGFVAGLAFNAKTLRLGSRRLVSISLAVLSCAFLLHPLIRPSLFPIRSDLNAAWQDGVCLQSHESSCGAAAAATLLYQTNCLVALPQNWANHVGTEIDSLNAEKIMADACLTSEQGTTPMGLIRGLRIATRGLNRTVSVADPNPTHWVANKQVPNIAVVQFQGSGRDPSRFAPVRRLLGSDGEGHAVVVLGRNADGMWLVADPAVGHRLWSDAEFRACFTGEAIYLAHRVKETS
ncbi:MAG: cysteine peptidase family C39 domain-containing protein [Planctomycetota bacterium]